MRCASELLGMAEGGWPSWMGFLCTTWDLNDAVVVILVGDVAQWARAQVNVAVGQSHEAQTTWAEGDWSVILVQERRNLIWIWILLGIGEGCTGLGDVKRRRQERSNLSCRKCLWRWHGERPVVPRLGMVVVMSLVDGVLLHDTTVVRDVWSVKVMRSAVVDVAVAVGEDRGQSSWWWRKMSGNSVVDSIQIVEDVVVGDVVEAENIRPLVGLMLRLRLRIVSSATLWMCWMVRNCLEWRRRWWTDDGVLIAEQSALGLHAFRWPRNQTRWTRRLRMDDREEQQKVDNLKELSNEKFVSMLINCQQLNKHKWKPWPPKRIDSIAESIHVFVVVKRDWATRRKAKKSFWSGSTIEIPLMQDHDVCVCRVEWNFITLMTATIRRPETRKNIPSRESKSLHPKWLRCETNSLTLTLTSACLNVERGWREIAKRVSERIVQSHRVGSVAAKLVELIEWVIDFILQPSWLTPTSSIDVSLRESWPVRQFATSR